MKVRIFTVQTTWQSSEFVNQEEHERICAVTSLSISVAFTIFAECLSKVACHGHLNHKKKAQKQMPKGLGRMRRGHLSCTTADLGEPFVFSLTGHALVNAAISRGGAESSMPSFKLEKKAVASQNPWIDCFARSRDRRQTFGTRTQRVHGFHCFYANLSWAKVLSTVASQGNH